MEDFADPEMPSGEELAPCRICGRRFFPKVLQKHVPICQKAATKKRKVFDSSRQRAEGTDISTLKPLKPKLNSTFSTSKSDKPEPPKKQSNWRRKHEEFIATIRAAKGLSQVMKDGGPLPPPPPPSFDPDYIQCPYCQRRFNENAAERHIKFCKEQAARIPNKGKVAGDTKGKPPARTQYKPPPVKKTNSPAVSVVSSASRLPQRSTLGQPTGVLRPGQNQTDFYTSFDREAGAVFGTQASKPPPAGSVKSASSGYSLPRTNPSGLTSPPSGLKPRTPTSPGSLKNTYSAAGMNKRKVSNADSNISRNDSKNAVEVDHPTGQQTKFCHECGTKFPVESAKFCCECGVRRMCI